jgi:hypothetical protein
MAKGICCICGKHPDINLSDGAALCMYADLEWHPSHPSTRRKTTYTALVICHPCAIMIAGNIAKNDMEFGQD